MCQPPHKSRVRPVFPNTLCPIAGPLTEARESITARLVALAKTHDVLTSECWEGDDLAQIVADALRVHAGDGQRCSWQGNPVRITLRIARALAMLLHELATNALKYGLLSNATGTVAVSWALSYTDGPTSDAKLRLALRWEERGGPPVTPPASSGFGSRMIERGLANEPNDDVRTSYELAGVVCALDMPLEMS